MSRESPIIRQLFKFPDGRVNVKWTIDDDIPDRLLVNVNGGISFLDSGERDLTIGPFPLGSSVFFELCCVFDPEPPVTSFEERKCTSETIDIPKIPVGTGPLPPPSFIAFESKPATLRTSNQITISWKTSTLFASYNVNNGIKGKPENPRVTTKEGSFELQQTIPGETYVFSVQGCDLGSFNCSSFSAPNEVLAARRLTSLIKFLDGVDAKHGIKSILASHSTKSLLSLMRKS